MNNNSKGQITRDMICKSHSARTERDLYRICPSNLSKRELEDLYFALLENNLDLKRTINSQKEKVKELSTKCQRMTASQRSTFNKEQKECCSAIKAAYNDQKESIADLKRTNERLTERIRLLNMRLCSVKQFLKRSPGQTTSCCMKCAMGPISTPKNSSVTTLNLKVSDSNLKSKTVSTQTLENYSRNEESLHDANISGNNVEDVSALKTKSLVGNAPEERICEENKCRTVMEEFKQKIVKLKLELSRCHEEYGERIGRLEGEVTSLRVEGKHNAAFNEQNATIDELTTRLREADINNRELITQLAIERGKVIEMETRLKAAQISSRVMDTIQHHLTKANAACKCPPLLSQTTASAINISQLPKDIDNNLTTQFGNQTPDSKQNSYVGFKLETNGERHSKNLDDSGYADGIKASDVEEDKIVNGSTNQEIMKKIEHIQAQFEHIKVPKAGLITPVRKPIGNTRNAAHRDKVNKAGIAEAGLEHLKEFPKSYPGYHCYGLNVKETDASLPKEYVENHATSGTDPVVIHKRITESSRDMTDPSMQIENKNNSVPTILQQPSLQKYRVDMNIPQKSWENTWDSVVIASTSKGFTEEAKMNMDENKINKYNKYEIPEPFPVKEPNFAKEHKKSNFKQQACGAKNKNIHVELQTLDETQRLQNDDKVGDPEIKLGKGKNLSFEDEHVKVNFLNKNTENILSVPSVETVSIADNNKLKSDSIEINRRRLTKDSEGGITVEPLKVLKNGKDVAVDCALIKNYCMTDYYTDDGQTVPGRFAQPIQGNEVKYNEQTITCGLRPHMTGGGPVILEEPIVIGTGTHMNVDDRVKLERDNNKKNDKSDMYQHIKGTNDFGVQVTPEPVEQYAPYRRSTVYPDTHTYTVQHNAENKSRDNDRDTDCEISELTDLPTEIDEKNPRQYLSPGEDKATWTVSSSRTGATTDLGSLSEGELPGLTIPRKLSEGEKHVNPIGQNGQRQTSVQKMESALQEITQELAKCKQLLLHQRRREGTKKVTDVEVMTDSSTTPIALKRAPGNQRIGDTFTPKCIFTLHIGTIVLSDEAVVNSMDMSLVLTWKFYDQSLTMTRMHSGRVVLFDFSTDYDIRITDEFLNYMKHEEMPIVICQIDKYEEPFASCSLPLRDALLHTNRRADMSLALYAGSQMRRNKGTQPVDGGDEVGVLDLWYMLRTESRLLPVINRAIIRPSTVQPANTFNDQSLNAVLSETRIMEQILDEDPSNDYRLSQEFDSKVAKRHLSPSIERSLKHVRKHQAFREQDIPKKGKRWTFSNLIGVKGRSPGELALKTIDYNADSEITKKYDLMCKAKESDAEKKSVTIQQQGLDIERDVPQKDMVIENDDSKEQSLDITVLWLALNDESNAMTNPDIQRLYVAYSFLGRSGADLETPISLPKPKNYADKCYFNFKKSFQLHESDLPSLGHMARCRQSQVRDHNPTDCIVFTVVSEPPEDPLGLSRCEDIGQAYVYLGDILSCSGNSNSYMEVVPVWNMQGKRGVSGGIVLGVLALRLDGLQIVRRCLHRSQSHRDLTALH